MSYKVATSQVASSAPPRNDGKGTLSVAPRNAEVANEDVRKLLDVICEIIADEYMEIAKKNKDVFKLACERPCPISEGKGAHSSGVGGKE